MIMLKFIVRYLFSVVSKLIGAFDITKMLIKKDRVVVLFKGDPAQGEGELSIMVPASMALEYPQFVERTTALIGWALLKPGHFWTSTELGMDAVESATNTLRNHVE